MHVVRVGDSAEQRAIRPIFVGEVYSRPLIDAATSPGVTVGLVRFVDGGKNHPHIHTADQILYVTEGAGIVGGPGGDNQVLAGDIVHIPAGEVHWHGAARAPHGAPLHPPAVRDHRPRTVLSLGTRQPARSTR